MSQIPNGVRTYRGSCHCGNVKFEVDLDFGAGSGRCNCTYCTKVALWGATVKPAAFRLLSDPEMLGDYSRSSLVHHRFCKRCGVRTHGHGDIPEVGGEFVSVSLNCLDDVDLSGVNVRYVDGRHDTWALIATLPHTSPFSQRNARA
ncbi:MAG: GFA family protein [Myxococcaceae bacterium]|nr:GFA family protein [Myxococcaceae bacterium]